MNWPPESFAADLAKVIPSPIHCLRAIAELRGHAELNVPIPVLAQKLGVDVALVMRMLRQLAVKSPVLVVYQERRGVRLTAAGSIPL